ncbi:shikimate kinase [Amycolatopsis keratiniphila subsp. nogabecina]|uniref:Shikimate kinase n=1 Tax=Amycolatopsis keratiniphila subsp. keratiniphila TaxID=227715 RepID=A0A1W2LN05_9PSEU|nr:shikimate kinase [Amycolatopsis keratiniphila subsp. nogabecina]ONF64282.1 shikimate kinase [Amycolatopsis keratiniphila subsp. keratiniphila]
MVTPRAVIIGPPGSGKSTVGPALAARLGLAFRDSDDDIVASAGKPITDIFAEEGEPAFRALEEEMVAKALAEHEGVLSLGGGAPITPGTRERLAGHTVIFLNVGMAAGVQRAGLSTARPLLAGVNPRATYKALLDARLPVYREVATFEIETDQLTADEVVEAAVIGLTEISKERA